MTDLATSLGTPLGTVLGTDLGAGGGAPVDPTDALIYALGPKLLDWIRPTDVVSNGANVASFIDRVNPLRTFDQPTPGLQSLLPTPNANANGRLAVQINTLAVPGNSYNSNQPPIYWKGFHDGTGVEAYFVGVPVNLPSIQTLIGTVSTNKPGANMHLAVQSAQAACVNDAGTLLFNMNRAVSATVGVKFWSRFHWQAGITPPEAALVTNLGAGTSVATPPLGVVALPPEFTMRLGIATSCNFWFLDWFRCLVLTPAERTNNVLAYMTARYGF